MFITAPIWPCAARRLIHTNRPTISTSGSTHSRMSPKRLLPVSTYFDVDVLRLQRLRGRPRGDRPSARSCVNSFLPPWGSVKTPLISPCRLVELDALDVAVVDGGHELRVGEVRLRRAAAGQAAHQERGGDEREHDPRHPAERRRPARLLLARACTLRTVGSGAASGPGSTRRCRGSAVRRGPAGSGIGAGIEIVGTTAHRVGPGFLLGRLSGRRPQPHHATAGRPPANTQDRTGRPRLGRRYRAAVRSTGSDDR